MREKNKISNSKLKYFLAASLVLNFVYLVSFSVRKRETNDRFHVVTYFNKQNIKSIKLTDSDNNTHLFIGFYPNGFLKEFYEFTRTKKTSSGDVLTEFQRLSLDSLGEIMSHTFMKDYKIISEGDRKQGKYKIKK